MPNRLRLCLLFVLLCISAVVFARGPIVKLQGKITGPVADSVFVTFNTNRLAYDPVVYSARLSRKDSFSMSLPVPEDGYTEAQIKYGNRQTDMILYPGYDLAITAKGDNFDTSLHYSGKGGAVENFVASHAIKRERMNSYANRIKPFMAQDSVKFVKSMETEEKTEMVYLDKSRQALPVSFINYWTDYYRYFTWFFRLQYPIIHEMTKEGKMNIQGVAPGNYDAQQNVPFRFGDSLLSITPYLLYVNNIFPVKLSAGGFTYKAGDTIKQKQTEDSIQRMALHILPPRTAEFFFAQNLYGKIRTEPLTKTEPLYNDFKQRWPESEYLPTINTEMDIAERLATGKPAPDFDMTTFDGKKMKLSDLKGKVVYISFWEKACRECVGEMMGERKMKDLMKDKPVVFLYVNIDDDTTRIRSVMQHYNINGIHTNIPGTWYSSVAKAYGLQQLPTYYLIDEEGKFGPVPPPTPHQETELILAIGKLLK